LFLIIRSMKGWFKLYSTRNYAEANIIKGMLEENNIQVVILNNLDSSYINFGDIELYVPDHLKDLAKNLLNQSMTN
jgi:hypothetical protein